MSKIKLTGSNSGYVEIASAADAGNLTLTLPTGGTALLSNAGNVFSGITTTGQLDINGSIDVSSTSVFNDDLTLTGASYNVVWDKSDNQLEFGDNAKLSFGASSDLQIYHNGSDNYIDGNSNAEDHLYIRANVGSDHSSNIHIQAKSGEESIVCRDDESVELYFNGNQKLRTHNSGVIITGICTATSFSGSGEGLTRTTQYSHRNVIVNGAMQVAQRGSSSASSDYGSVDRMKMTTANLDQLAFLQKQTSDGPDGFKNCFEFDVTTPENALDADDLVYVRYLVERHDLVPFFNANGTGKNFTLSFYVKAYQTGTYQVAIYKSQGPRFIARTYTIASSGVWQRVVLNFPGDTNTSGMDAASSTGFQISWIFAAGTNYTSGSTPTTWGGWPGNPGFAAGHAVNVASSANNYFRITGIQLELGDIATPFEHRSVGEELLRCQRYCQVYTNPKLRGVRGGNTGDFHRLGMPLMTPLRTDPSATWSGTQSIYDGGTTASVTGILAVYVDPYSFEMDGSGSGTLTVGHGSAIVAYTGGNEATLTLSAEL